MGPRQRSPPQNFRPPAMLHYISHSLKYVKLAIFKVDLLFHRMVSAFQAYIFWKKGLLLYNALYGMRKFELELFLWDFEIWPNRAKELFFFLSSFFLLSSFFQPSVSPIFDNVPMLRSFWNFACVFFIQFSRALLKGVSKFELLFEKLRFLDFFWT